MSQTAEPATASPRPAWLRYAWISIAIVVPLAVLFVVFWPRIKVAYWINGLDAAATRKECEAKLQMSDLPQVNDMLESALLDDGRTFRTREAVAWILWKRQRLADLESALRSGTPGARRAVISALVDQDFFAKDYLQDKTYAVRQTVLDWIGDAKDTNRSRAVQIALSRSLGIEDLVPLLRPLLAPNPSGAVPPEEQRQLQIAVGAALVQAKDCQSIPEIARIAREDPDDIVRLRFLDLLFRAVAPENAPCASSFPVEDVKKQVFAALDDPSKNVRLLALTTLDETKLHWAHDIRDRLLKTVEDPKADPLERRHSLRALSASRDEGLVALLPRLMNDPDTDVRSSAVDAADVAQSLAKTPTGLLTCFVGLFGREAASEGIFESALRALHTAAKDWVGLPDRVRMLMANRDSKTRSFVHDLFTSGEALTVTRPAWTKAWWDWAAGQLGLSAEEIGKAWAAREAFWKAADAGDAAGARKALDAADVKMPGVFDYEEGWLRQRAAR